jgi:hypothetical protein
VSDVSIESSEVLSPSSAKPTLTLIEYSPNDLISFLSRRMKNIERIEDKLHKLEESLLNEDIEKMDVRTRLLLLEKLSGMVLDHVSATSKIMSQVDVEGFMKALGLLEIYKKMKVLDMPTVKRMTDKAGEVTDGTDQTQQ